MSAATGSASRTRWLRSLALALLSTAVTLGAVEWLLRRYLPLEGSLFRPDARNLYALAPGARMLFRHTPQNGGRTVLVTVNSKGFRGDELWPGDHPRIVVYGDSCIEADYSPLAATFPRRLETRLREATREDVEVVNAGTNGYGPDQELRRFTDEVSWLRPRAVVFALFADNDFGDLVRNRLYRLEGDRLVEGGGILVSPVKEMFEPSPRARDFEIWKRLQYVLRRRRRQHRLTPEAREEQRRAAMADYLRSSLDLCRREFAAAVVKRDAEISDFIKDHYDADVSFEPDSEPARYKRELMAAVLREVSAAAVRARVPVLVLVVPSPLDICDACEIPIDPRQYPAYDRRRLTSELARAAVLSGLPVLDLFEPFRGSGPDGLYYRNGEDHWNAAGQDLAARLVAERIRQEGWLAPARRDEPR
jgi:lysophospholipase L1-like esterase